MSRQKRNRKDEELQIEQPRHSGLSGLLDLPPSALGGTSQIEISGNTEAVVDGCQGILEYDDNVIRLSTGKMGVKFSGRNLQIKVLTHDSAVISGYIMSVEFIT